MSSEASLPALPKHPHIYGSVLDLICDTPLVEVRRQEVLHAAPRVETMRVKLTVWQTLGLIVVIIGFAAIAVGMVASGVVSALEWGCKTGTVKSYCPAPPVAPQPPARPDIPA